MQRRDAYTERREWMQSLKIGPCVDCGQCYHPEAMQFDHLGDKVYCVSDLIARGWGRERMLAEIAKCELVCANCHAVRTYNRRSK